MREVIGRREGKMMEGIHAGNTKKESVESPLG